MVAAACMAKPGERYPAGRIAKDGSRLVWLSLALKERVFDQDERHAAIDNHGMPLARDRSWLRVEILCCCSFSYMYQV